MRPVTIRADAERSRLEDEIDALGRAQTELRDQLEAISVELGRSQAGGEDLTRQLDGVQAKVERADAYATSLDDLIGAMLVESLPPDQRCLKRPAGEQSRAICSLAIGGYRSLLSRSALSFERYAERWGWELVLSTEDLAEGRPASWAKIRLLQSLLEKYEWVLWLDADVVIVDVDADIGRETEATKDAYLVEHAYMGRYRGRDVAQYTANAGVMLLRSCTWTRALLDEIWTLDRYVDHPWWENAALLQLLGYGLEPARLVEPTSWLRRTKFVDRRWNSIELDRAESPAFIHRGFYDLETRSRQVTGDLACALGGADPLTAGWDRPARRIAGPADVHRREELPLLFNSLGLTGTGVEVGVRKGSFSEHLLEHWHGAKLISVDPWRTAEPSEYVDISNVSQDEHEGNYVETCRRLERFGPRSEVRRGTSAEVASGLPASCLDFLYLDARHDFASVREDLALWWPLIRPGGVIAGHDYLDGVRPSGVYGVRSAADGFFEALGLPVFGTDDDAPWPSWITIKPPVSP